MDSMDSQRRAAQHRGADGARWIAAFRLEALGALVPLLGETLQQTARALRGDGDGAPSPLEADLSVLRADLIAYEQRWRQALADGFNDWPRPAPSQAAGLTLLSNEELTSQLIGEPVIEALERRFQDVLEHTSSRLHTLSAGLGLAQRPSNPVAPRQLVEALLRTLPASECVEPLRLAALAQFERVCRARLTDFYAAFNVQLAESGFALQSGGQNAYASLDPRERHAVQAPEAEVGWRSRARASILAGPDATTRAAALRTWARRRAARDEGDTRRALSDRECIAVLSLLQADPDAAPDPDTPDLPAQLQARIVRGAASLGIDPATACVSAAQAEACVLAGALVEGLLDAHVLDAAARRAIAALCYPLCRQIVTDGGLFDDAAHPAHRLLDELLRALDANPETQGEDAALREAALTAVRDVLSDLHEPEHAFAQALAGMQARMDPLRARNELARRRAAQRVEGRARLSKARAAADAALHAAVSGRLLLPSVAEFLSERWHHALMQAWLRHGGDSEPLVRLVADASDLVELDARAARGEGAAVARGVLALEASLRGILLASGLDGAHADAQLAALVRDLARPDQARVEVDAGPPPGATEAGQGAATRIDADVDDWVTHGDGADARRMQVAWRDAASDRCLLLDRAGQRAMPGEVVDLSQLRAAGTLRVHRAHGPVEDLLRAWEAEMAAG